MMLAISFEFDDMRDASLIDVSGSDQSTLSDFAKL
jgi:hypothetical protein